MAAGECRRGDQHVHRALAFLLTWPALELPVTNPQKVRSYLEHYRPFFRRFHEFPCRQADRALWAFGRFRNSDYGPLLTGALRPLPWTRADGITPRTIPTDEDAVTLFEEPHFTFRFADDRITPRFHLEGIGAGRRVTVHRIDPGTGERLGLLASAATGGGGWVELAEPIIVRAGEAFVAVPESVSAPEG